MSLPLSYRSTTDKLIWQIKTQCTYTTKSDYKLLRDNEASTRPSTLNPTALSGFLKKIWSLKVPNKVKHFVWRACNETLPTKKNLFHRNVTKSAICGGCN